MSAPMEPTTLSGKLDTSSLVDKSHRFTGSLLPLLLTPIGCIVLLSVLIIIFKFCNYKRRRNTRRSYTLNESPLESTAEKYVSMSPVISEANQEHNSNNNNPAKERSPKTAMPFINESTSNSAAESDESPFENYCIVNPHAKKSSTVSTIEVQVEVHSSRGENLPEQLEADTQEYEDVNIPLFTT